MAWLATRLAEAGHRVDLITFSGTDTDAHEVHTEVRRLSVGGYATTGRLAWLRSIFTRPARLRRHLLESEADVVVSFMDMTNSLALLATIRTGIPVIISERVDPRSHDIGWSRALLRWLTYPRCATLVVQAHRTASWAADLVGRERVEVIPNPVLRPLRPPASTRRNAVIGIGRLDRQKGFDLLIEAFAAVSDKHPRWDLVIFGEGPEREALEEQVGRLRLTERVRLAGVTEAAQQELATAGIFVLASRYEGFPNALAEAMAAGAAVIAADCPTGPGEMVVDHHNGLLVPPEDVVALAAALDEAMSDEHLRVSLGEAAREIVDSFSAHKVFELWLEVIDRAIQRSPTR